MTRPRSKIVSLEVTPYYHCISRCVRRAFLCGADLYTGKNFDHRKPWLVKRLKLLEDVFSIDIAAYAIMSIHYHLVLHVDKERCARWSKEDVIAQWLKLYKGPALIHRYINNEPLLQAEMELIESLVELWRARLTSISWFMGCLNEYIARRANQEDKCKGRFWEGRFKSQALLDDSALISCMAYVDLNPIRASLCEDLSSSDFTSVQQRLTKIMGKTDHNRPRLMPFQEKQQEPFQCIPFNLKDYIELVDWTGRHLRKDKRGHIPAHKLRLLSTLALTEVQWQILALDIQKESILMLNGLNTLKIIKKRSDSAIKAA